MIRTLTSRAVIAAFALFAASQTLADPVNQYARSPTYSVGVPGYAAYATPTDLMGICGSSTKTIAIFQFFIGIRSTAAASAEVDFVRRSAVDTGGTPSTLTGGRMDSNDPLQTASLTSFGAAPSLGTLNEVVYKNQVSSTVLTGAGGNASLINMSTGGSSALPDTGKPLTLHGVNDCVYANFAGAALPSGFVASINLRWSEY